MKPLSRINKRHGYAALMMTMSLTVLCGTLGFVTDVGWAYYRKQAAQSAVEASVLAAASYAKLNGAVCGQNGVLCTSTPTSCATVTGPSSLATACQYAAANGFTDGSGSQTVVVTSGSGAPSGVSGVSSDYWVRVNVSESLPQLFSSVFGNNAMQVNTTAVSVATAGQSAGSVYVLGSGPATVSSDGTTGFNSDSDFYVNSSDPDAVQLKGNDNLTLSGGHHVNVVGGWQEGGSSTITPAPQSMPQAKGDPYINMPAPTDSGCSGHGNSDIKYTSGSHILDPGTYCGDLDIQGSASVTLNPGIYSMHGNVSVNTSGTVSGSGVTVYVKSGTCSMSGGNISLSPSASGAYKGVTIYQDRANTNQCTLKAGSTQKISGLIYAPAATLQHCGGSAGAAPNQTIVCKKIAFTGGTKVASTATTIYTAQTGLCR